VSDDGVTGICVPPCDASNTDCPTGYECNTEIGACKPPAPAGGTGGTTGDGNNLDATSEDSGSCSLFLARRRKFA
jgi:hypothetical protein